MCIDAVLDSIITVWVLGILDVVFLAVAFVSVFRDMKSTYDFEKMNSNYKKK